MAPPARSSGSLRLRLATLLLGQYLVWGIWFVSLGSWLGATLHFDGGQIGMIYGTFAVAGMLSPMLGGAAADRLAHTERILALLHAIGGTLLIGASYQRSFSALYTLIFAYALCYLPTLALVPSLAMRHLAAPAQEFPVLRAIGTVGWIVGGVIVGAMAFELGPMPMRIGGVISLALSAYCLSLPATPPSPGTAQRSLRTLLGLDAIGLLRDPVFAVFLLANVALCVPNQFYNAFASLYLVDLRAPRPATLLTIGQCTEVLVLLMLPQLRERLGLRALLIIGAATWAIRCAMFAFVPTASSPLLFAGLLLHGLAYGSTFIAGQVVVHERAPVHLRASAQGFWAVATMGVGNFVAVWLAGETVQRNTSAAGVHSWGPTWLVPAVVSLCAAIAVWVGSRGRVATPAT
jgi:nucleoside transporter